MVSKRIVLLYQGYNWCVSRLHFICLNSKGKETIVCG